MRLQILHDATGRILGILAPAEGSRRGGIDTSEPGTTVLEVESSELTLPGGMDEVPAMLAHLTDNYQVRAGRLVAAPGKSEK